MKISSSSTSLSCYSAVQLGRRLSLAAFGSRSARVIAPLGLAALLVFVRCSYSQSCGTECAPSLAKDEVRYISEEKRTVAWMLSWSRDTYDSFRANLSLLDSNPVAKTLVQDSADFESFHSSVERKRQEYFSSDQSALDYYERKNSEIAFTQWGGCMKECFSSRKGVHAWKTGEGPAFMQLWVEYIEKRRAGAVRLNGVVTGGFVDSPQRVPRGQLLPPRTKLKPGDGVNVHITRTERDDITASVLPGDEQAPDPLTSKLERPQSPPLTPIYGEHPLMKIIDQPLHGQRTEQPAMAWTHPLQPHSGLMWLSIEFDPPLPNLKLLYSCYGYHWPGPEIKSETHSEGEECRPAADNGNGFGAVRLPAIITEFSVSLSGAEKDNYEVSYDCYSPAFGTLHGSNGSTCGTDMNHHIQAIRVGVTAKRNLKSSAASKSIMRR